MLESRQNKTEGCWRNSAGQASSEEGMDRQDLSSGLETSVSSLAAGEVPEDWKVANIIPLFKKSYKDVKD